jgi:outer membrane lipoprotein-sorting protein
LTTGFLRLALGGALGFVCALALAQSRSGWTLDSVMKQLDAEAKNFRSLSANVEWTKVTLVVNDRSTEAGQIFVRNDDKMLIEFTQPDMRSILRNGDKIYIYRPRIKRVEEYDLGEHRGLVEQFRLLGFGTSGGDLKKGYLVTLLGEPTLDRKKVLLLELTPKSEKVRSQFSKIHLWVDPGTWLPVQQKLFETGSGDYLEIHYTNVVRNPKLPDSRFKPRWPKDVTRIRPQG